MVGAKMPTARDYLAFNPYALWDGIENDGFGKQTLGQHQWFDLANGFEIVDRLYGATSNPTFDELGMRFKTSDRVFSTGNKNGFNDWLYANLNLQSMSFTFTANIPPSAYAQVLLFSSTQEFNLEQWFFFYLSKANGNMNMTLCGQIHNRYIERDCVNTISVVLDRENNVIRCYITSPNNNDDFSSVIKEYSWNNKYILGLGNLSVSKVMYGLKVFNRAITKDEHLQIAAIDAARFKVPSN